MEAISRERNTGIKNKNGNRYLSIMTLNVNSIDAENFFLNPQMKTPLKKTTVTTKVGEDIG